MKLTDPDRLFPVEPRLRGMARAFYGSVKDLPVISPHGHCEPRWFAKNKRFANPAELLSAAWVQSLRLQLAAMPALAGLVQDIVITQGKIALISACWCSQIRSLVLRPAMTAPFVMRNIAQRSNPFWQRWLRVPPGHPTRSCGPTFWANRPL